MATTTRCKFRCYAVTQHDGGNRSVVLHPVYSSDPNSENKAFWEASPNGKLELTITNPAAADVFEPGAEYYLDISKAG